MTHLELKPFGMILKDDPYRLISASRWFLWTLVLGFLIILGPQYSSGQGEFITSPAFEESDAQWEITAEKLSYIKEENLLIAQGDVTVSRAGQRITARMAKYNSETGIVEMTGDVLLVANGDTMRGDRGIFDLNSQTGEIVNGQIFLAENNFYIDAEKMKRVGPDAYQITGARVTTCDGEKPEWSISASEVNIPIEGYGTLKDAKFMIRDIPVLYLPYAVFPAKTKRQTGFLMPRAGYSNLNGVEGEVPFFWALSDQTDATFYGRYMEKRGLMPGLEFRYRLDEVSEGQLQFDILSDDIEKKDMFDSDQVSLSPFTRTNQTRYWLRGKANQIFPRGVEARLDLDHVSDRDYLAEFADSIFGYNARPELDKEFDRPIEERRSPTRRSALRLSRDGELYSLQALGSYHQVPEDPRNDTTPQPLAGLEAAFLPRAIPAVPLFFNLETDYDYVWRETGPKGHRLSLSPRLSYPMWFGRYLALDSSLSYLANMQWFDNEVGSNDNQSQNVFEFNTQLYTVLDRIFDLEWGDIQRLKHKITPSLTYTFRDHLDLDQLSPWFEPINQEGDINQVTFAIENLFDVKRETESGKKSYAQLGSFGLSQVYNIKRNRSPGPVEEKKERFGPLIGTLLWRPLTGILADATAHWDHYSGDISFADIATQLILDRSNGRQDVYRVNYQYEKENNKNLTAYADVNLIKRFSAGTSAVWDLERDNLIENRYWLQYNSPCWTVRLEAGKIDDIESITISLKLMGFGG